MNFIRTLLGRETVRERAERELVENARDIFETERAIHRQRAQLALLRKRGRHLIQLTEATQ